MPSIDIAQQTTLETALAKVQNINRGVSYTNTVMGNSGSSESDLVTVTGKGVAMFSGRQQSAELYVKIDGATSYTVVDNMFGATVELSFNKSIEFYGWLAYVVQTI